MSDETQSTDSDSRKPVSSQLGTAQEAIGTAPQRAYVPEWLLPPLLALQFLTRLPLPDVGLVADRQIGRSLAWYPAVGLVIGACLYLAQWLLASLLPGLYGVQAALLLMLWCLITGGLHLDGLADSADAWLGGYGDRERTLTLMKDPTCGPAAVMLLVMVLLAKFAALQALMQTDVFWLLLIPVLPRTLLVLLLLTTDYVRPKGLGSSLVQHMPRRACRLVVLAVLLLCLLLGNAGVILMGIALLLFWWLRRLMLERLGGTTGDTAGALVELQEVAVLVVVLSATYT